MDKMKGLAKGGWHPSGDKAIHRDTWKSDLKGIASRKNKDPYEEQRNHQSRPLASLQDPDSFGAPPKHSAYYDANGVSRTGTGLSIGGASRSGTASSVSSGPSGGWGAPAVESGYAKAKREREERERQQRDQEVQEEKAVPYRTDTSGLRTDHLPKPPVRRAENASPAAESPAGRTSSPALPPRVPPRQAAAAPPPVLPPRQNEYPDEYTPAPPPPYNEALKQPQIQQNQNPAAINQEAAGRLSQAGVSIPGFGIGGNDHAQPETPATRGPPAGQLSELQQRFARMNTGASNDAASSSSPISAGNMLAAAAANKKPPPPPPKKAGLHVTAQQSSSAPGFHPEQAPTPPPLPMGSKPRPS